MNVFAREIKKERNGRIYKDFANELGFVPSTVRSWEQGTTPAKLTVERVAAALDWDNKLVSEIMSWLEEVQEEKRQKQVEERKNADYSELVNKFLKMARILNITRKELYELSGIPQTTVWFWLKGKKHPSPKYIRKMRDFIKVGKRVKPNKRYVLDDEDYELIREIEDEYEQVSNCPDDDKRLMQLQINLGVV